MLEEGLRLSGVRQDVLDCVDHLGQCGAVVAAAFRMLVAHSQSTNGKTREVAQRLMDRLVEEPFGPTVPLQQQVMSLLDDKLHQDRTARSEAG